MIDQNLSRVLGHCSTDIVIILRENLRFSQCPSCIHSFKKGLLRAYYAS